MVAESTEPDKPRGGITAKLSPMEWSKGAMLRGLVLVGIPDHLATGPKTAEELAEATGAHAPTLERVLRAMAVIGLLGRDDEGRYRQSDLTALLVGDSPQRDFVLGLAAPAVTRPFERIADLMLTGEPQTEAALGTDLWSYYAKHPQEEEYFARSMATATAGLAEALVKGYDLTPFTRIVDVGGGQGRLLSTLLQAAPHATGVLYEREAVRDVAEGFLREYGVADRVVFTPGDFLDEVPPGGDLYLLKSVLCDWPDESASKIAANVLAAAPSGATLLVLDWIRPEGPSFMDITDLAVLMANGGRIRTLSQFETLLTTVGFAPPRLHRLTGDGGMTHDALETTKP